MGDRRPAHVVDIDDAVVASCWELGLDVVSYLAPTIYPLFLCLELPDHVCAVRYHPEVP